MAQRSAAPVAIDAMTVDFDGFGRGRRHVRSQGSEGRRQIRVRY
jgi:hypothetical protein